jgi:hypothetical protein
MSEIITLELPESLAIQVKEIAVFTHQRIEDILLASLYKIIQEFSLESLSDEQILTLCELQLEEVQQEKLSNLLNLNQESDLNNLEVHELDALMNIYRRGMIYKAKAFQIAVERGLKPPIE